MTDYQGNEYEHIEYTPYGELFLEQVREGIESLPYRFTGKELDYAVRDERTVSSISFHI